LAGEALFEITEDAIRKHAGDKYRTPQSVFEEAPFDRERAAEFQKQVCAALGMMDGYAGADAVCEEIAQLKKRSEQLEACRAELRLGSLLGGGLL
jgi:hypothetical protein